MGASSREFCQIVTGSSGPHNLFTPISHQLGAAIESRENLRRCEEVVNRLCRPDEPVPIWQNSQSEAPIHTILSAFVPGGLGLPDLVRLPSAFGPPGTKADRTV